MVIKRKKISTFDGATFWKNAYAHQRAKILSMIDIPDNKISDMVNMAYLDLPLDIRYDIETSPNVDKVKLAR